MFRRLCSLYMLQRQVNDAVRSTASADASAALRNDGADFIHGEPTSHKLAGPKYVILAPDPCEDPEKVYVDVVVRTFPGFRQMTDVWETVATRLRELGPWICPTPGSAATDAAATAASDAAATAASDAPQEECRKIAMRKLMFVGRLDPAPVDSPPWLETENMFARRLSLKHLCDIIVSSGAITSKKDFFNDMFQTPQEVATAGDIIGIANRSRFTPESFVDWFFAFDTFSKCVLFYEAVYRFLQAQASPLSLVLDDIYCDIFTQIIRQSYITRVSMRQTLPDMALSPTSDTKLLPIDECVKNFLLDNIHTNELSYTHRDYRVATSIYGGACSGSMLAGGGDSQEVTETSADVIRKTLKRKNGDSYRTPFAKRKKQPMVTAYTVIDGTVNGKISPITIFVRNEPIVPTVHNHLLFPVFEADKPGSDILFFIKLKPFVAASLLLPGIFQNKQHFLHGECRWLSQQQQQYSLTKQKLSSTTWKYTLADYCPLKCSSRKTSPHTKRYGCGTTSTKEKPAIVQPLYF